jgi:pentalenene oxygenase
VVKETLRHRPPVPLVVRRAVQEDVVGGVRIPRGVRLACVARRRARPPPVDACTQATVVAAIFAMQHDPELFPRPDEFLPERYAASGAVWHR